MKLTQNQSDLLSCLTADLVQLKDICDKYALIQGEHGHSKDGHVWKSTVSRVIQALIVKGLVIKHGHGFYRLTSENDKTIWA